MKKLVVALVIIFALNAKAQTPKLFFTITSHNEMTSAGWNAEPYDTGPLYTYYHQTKDSLRKIVDMIYSKGAKYNLQTCQKFVFGCLHAESAATSSTDILEYAYKLGGAPYGRVVEIDPRYKTQAIGGYTYNIADVAHLIDSTGAKSSKTVGGFVHYNSTVTPSSAYSVGGDWIPFTTTITGVYQNWKPDIIWGAGSLPPHTHDANNFGSWKPRGTNDSIDFYCHDPNQKVWIQGNGCAWNLDSAANLNIQSIISDIRSEATKIANGTYPANKFYNASLMINFKDFKKFNLRASLTQIIDSINAMVTEKKIVWATISQKQDSFNVWSAAKSIPYSQWACGQTTTLAPTCNLSGVDEVAGYDYAFKFYPNPAENEIVIETEQSGTKENVVYVYDNAGRLVQKQTFKQSSVTLLLNKIQPGVYLVKINDSRAKKLIISR